MPIPPGTPPPTEHNPTSDGYFCGSHKSGGTRRERRRDDTPYCTLRAGWGTDHPGWGRCKFHGGATTTGIKAARQQRLEAEIADLDLSQAALEQVNPADQLLAEIARTRYIVDKLDALLSYGGLPSLTNKVGESEREIESVWRQIHEKERAHLLRCTSTALKVGLEARRVEMDERLAEQVGGWVETVIRGALAELGVESSTEVDAVVGRQLRLVAGEAS